jgi:hypothetical protein
MHHLPHLSEAVLAWWRLGCLGAANVQERSSNAMHVARHLRQQPDYVLLNAAQWCFDLFRFS